MRDDEELNLILTTIPSKRQQDISDATAKAFTIGCFSMPIGLPVLFLIVYFTIRHMLLSTGYEHQIGIGAHFFYTVVLGILFFFLFILFLQQFYFRGWKKSVVLFLRIFLRVVLCFLFLVCPVFGLFAQLTSEYVALIVLVPIVVFIFKSGILIYGLE
ncbi:MAG: hypothetical protein Q4D98_09265 [Planctomycetia bacterium]|nr:hypothetical protein [Planctomycetia bacterium]